MVRPPEIRHSCLDLFLTPIVGSQRLSLSRNRSSFRPYPPGKSIEKSLHFCPLSRLARLQSRVSSSPPRTSEPSLFGTNNYLILRPRLKVFQLHTLFRFQFFIPCLARPLLSSRGAIFSPRAHLRSFSVWLTKGAELAVLQNTSNLGDCLSPFLLSQPRRSGASS